MATVVEHTFGTKQIRSIIAADGYLWSNASDVIAACGYSKLVHALAACKAGYELQAKADGQVYLRLPTVLQIAGRRGYSSFLRWVSCTLSPLEQEALMPVEPMLPEPAPANTEIIARRSIELARVDDVMAAVTEGVAKQMELQAMAMSCKVLRETGMPYDMQQDLQRKLADKMVEMINPGDRCEDYVSAGQILLERGIPACSVSRLECEFGKDLMLLARKENIELPPIAMHMHQEVKQGCCRVWHRVHHAEFIADVLESFSKRPIWEDNVSERAEKKWRLRVLETEGRGRKHR